METGTGSPGGSPSRERGQVICALCVRLQWVVRFHLVRREAPAHGVFGDAAREQEFVEVVRAAGLGADA